MVSIKKNNADRKFLRKCNSMNIEKTKEFYKQIKVDDLCNCVYCQNYVRRIKLAYPSLADYLNHLGVDIAKPFDTMPLEQDEMGYIEYISAQYIVYGESSDFIKATIDSVNVDIAESHPSIKIEEVHFVIEVYPIRLEWGI